MGPKIIKKKSFQLIGYCLPTQLSDEEERKAIQHTVSRLQSISDKIPNKVRDDVYVIHIYPLMEQFNPFLNKERLIIGYEVQHMDEAPDDTTLYTMEENMYVNCKHTGTKTDVYKTYDFLYNNWLQQNRFIPLGYDMEVWKGQNDSNVDICVAINKIS
ncbi:effector binding domain-containing protein [Ornithinibacillus sp. BX22]|uniref:Effector binding domain-containing protein n=2 Tax=Ornithinibacillus TaxID=484508 RepID=A0A923L2S5_9BACI|nr:MULTISPECIES: GyrI-like domain-containing protein [Ornithinibacillus]MBC5635396.1 effector binding domain-containing protein [Ornithinibacillus hominis]MBS3679005.1 effector binding domain-containing protein [Ornithinibacillus massiliensis]